jgi:Na+/proline symporter
MYIIAKVQDRYTQYKIGSLEEFSVSSHSLKPGFVACGIVSAWTWSATLLISTSITFGAGMSGGWWYGCLGGCVICLFVRSL